jgi:hypothetical protein
MNNIRRPSRGQMTLDELAREGAQRMIAGALETEVDEYVQPLPIEDSSEWAVTASRD